MEIENTGYNRLVREDNIISKVRSYSKIMKIGLDKAAVYFRELQSEYPGVVTYAKVSYDRSKGFCSLYFNSKEYFCLTEQRRMEIFYHELGHVMQFYHFDEQSLSVIRDMDLSSEDLNLLRYTGNVNKNLLEVHAESVAISMLGSCYDYPSEVVLIARERVLEFGEIFNYAKLN